MPDITLSDINQRIDRMERMIRELIKEKNITAKQTNWIGEKDAAEIIGWSPAWFRRKVKSGDLPIRYKNFRGRNFKYLRSDIDRVIKSETFNI